MDDLQDYTNQLEILHKEIFDLAYLKIFLEVLIENPEAFVVDLCEVDCLWIFNNTSYAFYSDNWELIIEQSSLANSSGTKSCFSFECDCFAEKKVQFSELYKAHSFQINVFLKTKYFQLEIFRDTLDEIDTLALPINYIPQSIKSKFVSSTIPIDFKVALMREIINPISVISAKMIKNDSRAIGKLKDKMWEVLIKDGSIEIGAEKEIYEMILICIKRRIDGKVLKKEFLN